MKKIVYSFFMTITLISACYDNADGMNKRSIRDEQLRPKTVLVSRDQDTSGSDILLLELQEENMLLREKLHAGLSELKDAKAQQNALQMQVEMLKSQLLEAKEWRSIAEEDLKKSQEECDRLTDELQEEREKTLRTLLRRSSSGDGYGSNFRRFSDSELNDETPAPPTPLRAQSLKKQKLSQGQNPEKTAIEKTKRKRRQSSWCERKRR